MLTDFEFGYGEDQVADEPLFMAIPGDDPQIQQSVLDAQASLNRFRLIIRSPDAAAWHPCIKIRLTDGEDTTFSWLLVVHDVLAGFVTDVIQVPSEFKTLKAGDTKIVLNSDVLDWMVNQAGTLYGGFSLRYQRSKMPAERRTWFDEYIGVSKYAEPDASPDLGSS